MPVVRLEAPHSQFLPDLRPIEIEGFGSWFAYNYFVHPVFSWVDCASRHCSDAEFARRFFTAPMLGAALAAGGPLAGAGIRTVAATVAKNTPAAVATAFMQMSPDALVGVATHLELPEAEALEQVLNLKDALEGMEETSEAMEVATKLGTIVP
jgi:hypothetical protein